MRHVACLALIAAAIGVYWWVRLRCCPLCGRWRGVTRHEQHGKCLRCQRHGTFTWPMILASLALVSCVGCATPRAVTVTIRSSQPIRAASDSNVMQQMRGPLSTAATAFGSWLSDAAFVEALGITTLGQVAMRIIERTSDAEFELTTITVPVAPGQTVTVTGEPGGKTTVTVGDIAPASEGEIP